MNRNRVHKAIMGIRNTRFCTSSLLWHQSLDCHVQNNDKSNSTIHQTVVDTGSKFATGIFDTGSKFATGINDASGAGAKMYRRCR
jgi:hypothetical protein